MTERLGATAHRLSDIPYEKRVCRIEHGPASLRDLRIPPAGESASDVQTTMEEEINAWLSESGAKVIQMSGNIAPQTQTDTGLGGGGSSFSSSDVILMIVYEG